MTTESPAILDRRVQLLSDAEGGRDAVCRLNELRQHPFIVLLGEPGIGKSTTLQTEAAAEGAHVLTVRELINAPPADTEAALFLDALDEYRIDGSPADKTYQLAYAIEAAGAPRWRLACRAEDWRKEADITAIQRAAVGAPIVVAQLLPLDAAEAAAVLAAFGESDPEAFLGKARRLGASGFVETPISLRLLQSAVADEGEWPTTRFDLFASATRRLAHERNPEYRTIARSSPDEILAAAGHACLLLLSSGAQTLWASNGEPSRRGQDRRAFLTSHDLRIEHPLLRAMLDTALFRGEGEAFEPMHRTVAEFLAAQALARAVVGSGGRAALPLGRALALITGADGAPPTELRGLYAWFAAHLARLGDQAGARRLVEADAFTVLAYGDAAALGLPARQAILQGLARTDPYFLSSSVGVTALGGLAGEDLADDLAAVLERDDGQTHLMVTVLQALASGQPVASLQLRLRAIALDPARPEWQRLRAADAWVSGASDTAVAQRELFDALASEPVSIAREALRVEIAASLPPTALSTADICSVIADFERSHHDNKVMRLYRLRCRLEAEPRPELFDAPMIEWRPAKKSNLRALEVDDFLDHLLAAAICSTPDLSAARLWRWLVNTRPDEWSAPRKETAAAVTRWLEAHPGRDIELFDAILAEDKPDHASSAVCQTYVANTGWHPSGAIVRHVLAASTMATSETAAKRLLGIAVAMARRPEAEPAAFWQVFERVSHEPGCKRLLQQLTTTTIDRWQRNKRCRALRQRRREAKAKTARIQRFAPILAGLRVGHHGDLLDWAAQEYFDETDGPPDQPHEIGRLVYLTDEATAVAIAVGWEYLATVDLVDVTAARLGAAETQSYRYKCGAGALAGLDRLLEKQRLPDLATMPIDLAIVVLHAGHLVRDGERRQRLERWAAARLDRDPSAGAATLHAFWAAALDAGATHLSGLSPLTADEMCGAAAAQAIDALLRTRRTIPPYALRAALGAAAKCLGAVRLLTLAESALDDPAVVDTQRTIWSFVAFVLAPTEHGERLLAARRGTEMAELFDDSLYEGLIRSLGNGNESDQTHRLMVTVRLFGSLCTLDDGLRSGAVTPAHHASDAVRRAINALGAIPHAAAGTALASLIGDPGLAAWHANLRHAHAQYARLRRDSAFQHPTPTAIREAIAGGPPVNAADLRAVVVEEIGRLQAELHAGNTTPWKAYWNTDSNGQVLAPRVENDCRDRLLERLHDRLGRYGIAAALPEARRGEEKRADVLFLSGAGRNLPLEAKRHRHADLWTAASTQLQGYAASEGADGSGIYLVFWFGVAVGRPPARPDGAPGPTSAAELQRMLVDDLAPELRTRTDVIVFDVSDSSTGSPPPPRPFGTRGRKSRARTGNPG